jgi:prepilin-type N-terminal cleavage/methylation domain-containing protein
MCKAKAFTLVEILIVVVLLGILAVIVIPGFARSNTFARDATLKTNLKLLRRFVLVYTSHHLEIAPGYPDGDVTAMPTDTAFRNQALLASNAGGQTAPRGTAGFRYGPYLSKIPANPFNQLDTIQMLANGAEFPAEGDNSHGWICKPDTGEIRADNTGTDEAGKAYRDY